MASADLTAIPYGCCHCGCGRKTGIVKQANARLGYVKGEPFRYVSGHNRRSSPVDWIEEDRCYTTPCWIWQLSQSSTGYGQATGLGGRPRPAHRVVYERIRGPIPKGLELDHLCRVPLCVNPDHLEPVTHAENMRRGANTTLTAKDVALIRRSSLSADLLALRYGVSARAIYSARNHDTWKDDTWKDVA